MPSVASLSMYIVCIVVIVSLTSATAHSFAYVSSPAPAALPLCRVLHKVLKVRCTTAFGMAYTNYKVGKQTIHIETEFHSHGIGDAY